MPDKQRTIMICRTWDDRPADPSCIVEKRDCRTCAAQLVMSTRNYQRAAALGHEVWVMCEGCAMLAAAIVPSVEFGGVISRGEIHKP